MCAYSQGTESRIFYMLRYWSNLIIRHRAALPTRVSESAVFCFIKSTIITCGRGAPRILLVWKNKTTLANSAASNSCDSMQLFRRSHITLNNFTRLWLHFAFCLCLQPLFSRLSNSKLTMCEVIEPTWMNGVSTNCQSSSWPRLFIEPKWFKHKTILIKDLQSRNFLFFNPQFLFHN